MPPASSERARAGPRTCDGGRSIAVDARPRNVVRPRNWSARREGVVDRSGLPADEACAGQLCLDVRLVLGDLFLVLFIARRDANEIANAKRNTSAHSKE